MTKAWLRDDPPCALPADDGRVGRVVLELEDDFPCGLSDRLPYSVPITGLPDTPTVVDDPRQRVQVLRRSRTGFDGDGNPLFAWEILLDGLGLFSSIRREFDAVAGLTHVEGKLMVEYDGGDRVFETSVVRRMSDDSLWRVLAVAHPYGRLEFSLRLIDQETSTDSLPQEHSSFEFTTQDDGDDAT